MRKFLLFVSLFISIPQHTSRDVDTSIFFLQLGGLINHLSFQLIEAILIRLRRDSRSIFGRSPFMPVIERLEQENLT